MTTAIDRLLTLDEFLALPETQPECEFIAGRIYQKPLPQGKHSRLQLKLCTAINQVVEERQIALLHKYFSFYLLSSTQRHTLIVIQGENCQDINLIVK